MMIQEKKLDEELKALKTKISEGKAILGQELVLKQLKTGALKKILLAKNCPAKLKEDLSYYAKIANVPVLELEQSNEELGILCKKNFFISVAGIKD